ncbi:hypothetical protein [Chryseobacterium sp. RLHN22]
MFRNNLEVGVNPDIYYFEIQNKKADENTSFEDFVKDASLKYLGHGGIQL